MQEKTETLWPPAGVSLPSLGSRLLVSVSDGDTSEVTTKSDKARRRSMPNSKSWHSGAEMA